MTHVAMQDYKIFAKYFSRKGIYNQISRKHGVYAEIDLGVETTHKCSVHRDGDDLYILIILLECVNAGVAKNVMRPLLPFLPHNFDVNKEHIVWTERIPVKRYKFSQEKLAQLFSRAADDVASFRTFLNWALERDYTLFTHQAMGPVGTA